ncbi:hypothetical protein BC629DRAFT_397958 [Irpex lacteus]|nr:hypothetical protein BC629DRAFT_397958 [Irpex lacteus]
MCPEKVLEDSGQRLNCPKSCLKNCVATNTTAAAVSAVIQPLSEADARFSPVPRMILVYPRPRNSAYSVIAMSSAEEDASITLSQGRKKRRRMRACDMCRRRKVRCDGGQMPNGVCTNCITFKYKCTYVQSAPKRVPDSGYLESLETQMSEMRTLLNKYRALYPDAELSDDLNRIVTGSSPFASRAVPAEVLDHPPVNLHRLSCHHSHQSPPWI